MEVNSRRPSLDAFGFGFGAVVRRGHALGRAAVHPVADGQTILIGERQRFRAVGNRHGFLVIGTFPTVPHAPPDLPAVGVGGLVIQPVVNKPRFLIVAAGAVAHENRLDVAQISGAGTGGRGQRLVGVAFWARAPGEDQATRSAAVRPGQMKPVRATAGSKKDVFMAAYNGLDGWSAISQDLKSVGNLQNQLVGRLGRVGAVDEFVVAFKEQGARDIIDITHGVAVGRELPMPSRSES